MAQPGLSVSPVPHVDTLAQAGLPFDRLPEPDYDRHPAYGRAFGKPTLALRLKAITTLAPWLVFVLVKRMLLFDRLQSLPDYGGPMSGGVLGRLTKAPRYVPLVVRALAETWQRRLFSGRQIAVPEPGVPLLDVLRDQGITVTRLSPEEVAALNTSLDRPITKLLKQRGAAGKTTFEANQVWLNTKDYANVYTLLDRALSERGIIGAASGYLRRPVTITHLTLQINDARDAFHHNKFADVGCPDPATNYMHVDTTFEILKCMIYLNEVTALNGPFSYVIGSSKLRVGFAESLVRRAVDRCGLTGYARGTREMFMALPRALRKKCTFGSDLTNGTPEVNALIAAEYQATSADGNVVLFDNLGIHRGALATNGERRILVATLG